MPNSSQVLTPAETHTRVHTASPPVQSLKGVVFNEMKGVYSQPDSVYYRTVQQVWTVRGVGMHTHPHACSHWAVAWLCVMGEGVGHARFQNLQGCG
eukprot:36170-Chlamydomonas_euryale.AAC.4